MPESELLTGRVAAVMGGGGGIGLACVEGLLAEGAAVLMGDVDQAKGEASAARLKSEYGTKVEFQKADVASSAEVDAAIEKAVSTWGGLDILVNVVGVNIHDPIEETSDEDFAKVIDTNLRGAHAAIRASVPHMKQRGAGSIISIGSIHGEFGYGDHHLYIICKAGLNGMTKELAFTLGPDLIRVNVVAPGYISSHKTPEDLAAKLKPEAVEEFWRDWAPVYPIGDAFYQPLRSATHSRDVADAVAFLASDRSRLITGEVLHVDGGLSTAMFRYAGRPDYVAARKELEAQWKEWFGKNKAE